MRHPFSWRKIDGKAELIENRFLGDLESQSTSIISEGKLLYKDQDVKLIPKSLPHHSNLRAGQKITWHFCI